MNDQSTKSMAAITAWLLGPEARNLPNAAAILKALCPRPLRRRPADRPRVVSRAHTSSSALRRRLFLVSGTR